MKPDLILSLQGHWYCRRGNTWEVSKERPRLTASSRVLSDFDGAPAGVMSVDNKPDFAPAVIEKRLRAEGLVEGETRVLAHRVVRVGGGCRVLYTAVPVTSWHAMFAWLGGETSLGLVFSVDATMLALARRHGAVLCRIGRQFRFMVSQPDALHYITTTAFSEDPDDLDTALQNLIDQVSNQWQARGEQVPVLWCDLLASGQDDTIRLEELFRQRLNAKIDRAPVTRFLSGTGTLRTAADAMAQAVPWHAAANPWPERLAAAADLFRLPITAVTLLFGIAFFAAALFWTTQTLQLQAQSAQLRQDAEAINQRTAGQNLTPERVLAVYADTFAFLDNLSGAVRSPDLFGFITDLRRAADQQVRVMRVRLASPEGTFRVDGVPAAGAAADRALSNFLGSLRTKGYQVSAEDPGNQSQQPGFFSYSVRRIPDGATQ